MLDIMHIMTSTFILFINRHSCTLEHVSFCTMSPAWLWVGSNEGLFADSFRAQIFGFNETVHQRHPAESTSGVCICVCVSVHCPCQQVTEHCKGSSIDDGQLNSLLADAWVDSFQGRAGGRCFSLALLFREHSGHCLLLEHIYVTEFAVCGCVDVCVHVVKGKFLTLLLHKRAAALISIFGAGFICLSVAFSISHTLCHVHSYSDFFFFFAKSFSTCFCPSFIVRTASQDKL